MAEDTPPRQMSLIPYPVVNGEVVLRRGNAIVVYNAESRQLSVVSDGRALELSECPYCHRPMRDDFLGENQGEPERPPSTLGEQPYVDPDYFGMLAASHRPSPATSGTSSPPNRAFLYPPLRSGKSSRHVSATQDPPSGAEFVGSAPATSAHHSIHSSAFSPGFFKQFFIQKGLLGKGGFGVVLLVEHRMAGVSLGQFACKRIPVGNNQPWLEKVLLEVKLLQKIPHRNLVAYHWVWLEDHQPADFGPSIPCLWILQEYCNGGDLQTYVVGNIKETKSTAEQMKERIRKKSKGEMEPPQDLRGPSKLTFEEIFSFFKDITSGLHHLHTQGYIHRDLKPSNCLLQKDGSRIRVLVSDFGEVQAADAERESTGATGTISYCAPEVLVRDNPNGPFGNFTTKSDIFSLGMIVYFMCFGRLPYSNADDINEEKEDLDELKAEITKWPGFDDATRARPDLPERLYRYLKRLLSVDPDERPSTGEILASINRGADNASAFNDDSSSRVSPLDSPRPHVRRAQSQLHRPTLSSIGRHNSHDDARALSPVRRTHQRKQSQPRESDSRPNSPVDGSMVRRPRAIDLSLSDKPNSPQHSPRLILPPPERQPASGVVLRIVRSPTFSTTFRALLFLAKLLSLTFPCVPLSANTWLLIPLLVLAATDVGIMSFDLRRSVLLLGFHLTVVALAGQHNRLCEKVMVWDDL